MASEVLANMKEEVTCPLCLELLKEPLSLDCGHSFCKACITKNNKESLISQGEESSCPVCRISYQPGNLRPNRHLSNIVEMLQNVKLNPEEEEKTDLCVHHGEKLLLFCKEDGKFICWLCERSQKHRGHHTFLMEEVAQEYQEKLQAALKRLKAEERKAEKLKADIREERTSWENQIKNETQSIQDCFQQLRAILYNKEQKELQKLEKEKREILHVLEQSENEQVQQSQLLRDLISDLEHRLQGSTREMLQDVNGVMKSSQTFTLKEPKTISKEQRRVFRVPDLNGMLQIFDELTEVRRYWAHITLDPPKDRRNRNVAISADRRQVKYEYHCNSKMRQEYSNRCQENDYGVLGVPAITSGKHYWEVDVSEKYAWILGVCCQKYPNLSLFQDLNNVHVVRKADSCPGFEYYDQRKTGYWVIGLVNKFKYNVLSESPPSSPLQLTLCLTVPPHRVGVFIDCTACTVSFYNITNHGFLIYKFSQCSFSQKIEPYFNPMTSSAPLTLCSPSS